MFEVAKCLFVKRNTLSTRLARPMTLEVMLLPVIRSGGQ
jgi:hypothetical protein